MNTILMMGKTVNESQRISMQYGCIHKLPSDFTKSEFTKEVVTSKEAQKEDKKKYIDENHKTSHI